MKELDASQIKIQPFGTGISSDRWLIHFNLIISISKGISSLTITISPDKIASAH
jgi:hypothetical protein